MNEILHSIANRGTGWNTRAFPSMTSFIPSSEDDAEKELRAIAMLRPGDPDYYTVGAIGTVESCPLVKAEFSERGRNYMLSLRTKPVDQFTPSSAFLRADLNGPAQLCRVADEWPVNFVILIECLGGAECLMRYGDQEVRVPCRYGNGYLIVDWPTDCGISGRISISTWETGDLIRIDHEPAGFPAHRLIEKLKQSSYLHLVLDRSGLGAEFNQSADPTEKAAIFYLALGRYNKAVYR